MGLYKYELQIADERSYLSTQPEGLITTGCLVMVYDAGTKTLGTIYSDVLSTAKTNPISRSQFATDGKLVFFSASSSVDITVAHSDGSIGKYLSVTPFHHTLYLQRGGVQKCLIFPMIYNAGGTETDTGIDLPYNVHVHDVLVEVVDVDATETVDVGLLSSETAGDADGFIAALSVASAGFIKPHVNTAGGNETYVSTAKYGVLMGPAIVGTDVDKDNGIARGFGHIVSGSNAVSVTYTPSSSDTFTGYGYIWFRHLR